jgi:hypothetical protein
LLFAGGPAAVEGLRSDLGSTQDTIGFYPLGTPYAQKSRYGSGPIFRIRIKVIGFGGIGWGGRNWLTTGAGLLRMSGGCAGCYRNALLRSCGHAEIASMIR